MPIKHKRGQQRGEKIVSPAYLDACFLVHYSVGALQASIAQTEARNVMGDLLVQDVTMLVSLVSIEEAWWAILGEIYCKYIWQPTRQYPRCHFNRKKAKSHWNDLINHKDELNKIVGNLLDLRNAGADIRIIPGINKKAFEVCQDVPDVMQSQNLFSADALHLSLALSYAQTLITFDHDFERVLDPRKSLTILLLPS